MESAEKRRDFEAVTRLALQHVDHGADLRSILADCGWTGAVFNTTDFDELRQTLGTKYLEGLGLEKKRTTSSARLLNTFAWDDPDNVIKSYCPNLLLGLLELPSTLIAPSSIRFDGCCLLADISGFTKLSAELSSRGSDGLDDLHKVPLLSSMMIPHFPHSNCPVASTIPPIAPNGAPPYEVCLCR